MTEIAEVYRQQLHNLRGALHRLLAQHQLPVKEQVEFDDGFRRPSVFGSEYVHYYTNYRILLSHEDLDDISDKIEIAANISGGTSSKADACAISYLLAMLERRLRELADTVPFNVISLGSDCLPRSVPTKWGLKPPRLLNEPSMPFDLAVHPIEAVVEILENDFEDYLEPSRLSFDTKKNMCVDSSRGILWNHETGSGWAANGFVDLIERYRRRIANFHAAQTSEKPSIYVMHVNGPIDGALARVIYRIARAVASRHKYKAAIACISTTENGNPRLGQILAPIEWLGRVPLMVVSVPKPFAWYQWPTHQHFTMPEGLVFEQRIIEGLVQAYHQIVQRR